ncbi:MAG: 2-C-methyl-D-erythritol 4-phosphate cytidylyltransferase [Bacilli bacterium]|nr:2-C-methyl-D-erythritol 4-phosphate cytidylyltransferase [Bacilli bacterium]
MKEEVTGILLIAGSSTRYQKGYNKNFERINNHPVFYYSLKVMEEIPSIKEILLVIKKEEEIKVKEILKEEKMNHVKTIIGGNSRKESVYKALKKSKYNIVLIHDGARPLIKEKFIKDCIQSMKNYQGAVTAMPVKDTIKIINDKKEIETSTKREYTYIAQTPQCFDKEILLKLHEKYKNDDSITDDAMLLEKENIKVKIVDGSYNNIKLTTKEDYIYIKEILERGEEE